MRRVLISAAIVAMTFASSLAYAQSAVNFTRTVPDPSVGSSPLAIAAADLNNDGKTDLAVANNESGDVSLLMGNGDGTFTELAATFPVGSPDLGPAPSAIAIGDVDKDGKPDLVVTDEIGSTVNVLLNQGGLLFGSAISTDTGGSPEAIVLGDFDNDGTLDAATADNFDDTVSFLKGLASGAFGAATPFDVGTEPAALAAGKLDADNNLDLVSANSSGGNDANGSVSVLKGNGDGTFTVLPEIQSPLFNTPVAIALADVNGDGKLDIIVANEDANTGGPDTILVLLGNGDDTFQAPTSYNVGFNGLPEGIAAADFNGDGHIDIATTENFTDNVSVLVGVGGGAFPTLAAALGASDAAATLSNAASFPSSGTIEIDSEVITYSGRSGNMLTGLTRGAQNSSAAAHTSGAVVDLIFATGAGPFGIVAADLNGDSRPDLATSNMADNTATALISAAAPPPSCGGDCNGDGSVTVPELITMVNVLLGNANASTCTAGDVNHDGTITVPEIVTAVNNLLNGCSHA